MRKLEREAIIKIIDGYCYDGQTPQKLASEMGTNGVNFCQGGGLAIYDTDMLKELQTVYGDQFDVSKYLTKYGARRWAQGLAVTSDSVRYRNGMPYVFTVYCEKFGKVLDELKAGVK